MTMTLRDIEASAYTNRWRMKSGPVAVYCAGLMACAMLLPSHGASLVTRGVAWTAALAGARVPPRTYALALLVPGGFIGLSAIVLCLSLNTTADGLPTLIWSANGARQAVTTALRSLAAVSVTLLFACTVPCTNWLAWLRRARTPESLLDLILLVYRMLFLLDDQRASLIRAQQNRLGYLAVGTTLRSAAFAASALFVRSMERASRMERGLAARGYTDRLPTLPGSSLAKRADYALAISFPLCLGLVTGLLKRNFFS